MLYLPFYLFDILILFLYVAKMTDCSLTPFSITAISPHLHSSLLFPQRIFSAKYNTIFLHISKVFFFFLFNFKSSFSCSLLTCWLNSKASPLTNFFWAHVLGGNHGVGRRQWMWLLLTIHSVCTLDQWAGIMLSSDFSKCSVVNRTELSKIKHVEQSLPSQCFPIFCLLEKDRGGRRKGEKRETL